MGDPVMQAASDRLEKFYSETFWLNNDVPWSPLLRKCGVVILKGFHFVPDVRNDVAAFDDCDHTPSSNVQVFACNQAAIALAKRGENIVRCFIGVSPGGQQQMSVCV